MYAVFKWSMSILLAVVAYDLCDVMQYRRVSVVLLLCYMWSVIFCLQLMLLLVEVAVSAVPRVGLLETWSCGAKCFT